MINRLQMYSPEELSRIVRRSAGILGTQIDDDAAIELASRSRGTPRVANRLLKRVRDFAEVKGTGVITLEAARYGLEMLEVDEIGLDGVDKTILETIHHEVRRRAGRAGHAVRRDERGKCDDSRMCMNRF